ncbi:Uncharacterised protein [Shewanella algae]|uniref:Uncharacterized protein n=1 Tax=Shewanella algae TaxID=38313 RepID=A0A379Z204_9GAMM|nr:Uncharacterised protein [Shewanella algae]
MQKFLNRHVNSKVKKEAKPPFILVTRYWLLSVRCIYKQPITAIIILVYLDCVISGGRSQAMQHRTTRGKFSFK